MIIMSFIVGALIYWAVIDCGYTVSIRDEIYNKVDFTFTVGDSKFVE